MSSQVDAPKPVYAVFNFTVTDPERLAKYKAKVRDTVKDVEGFEFLAGAPGQTVTTLEGPKVEGHVVLLRFGQGRESLDKWYNSDAYQAIIKDRTEATVTLMGAYFD